MIDLFGLEQLTKRIRCAGDVASIARYLREAL